MIRYLAVVWLVGCGARTEPTYTTRQGFDVFCAADACFPVEEVEAVIDTLINELTIQLPGRYTVAGVQDTLEYFRGANRIGWVSVGPRGFECVESFTGWCAGLTYYGWLDGPTTYIKVARLDDCISANALTHELIHVFQSMFHSVDGGHQLEVYWSKIKPVVNAKISAEFCNSD